MKSRQGRAILPAQPSPASNGFSPVPRHVGKGGRMFGSSWRSGRRGMVGLIGSAATALACGCGRALAQQPMEHGGPVPGADKSVKSTMLGLGADLLQNDSPISSINMYLNGFHFYADDMGRQIEAHHYCTHINEEFFQCVIYDGNRADSAADRHRVHRLRAHLRRAAGRRKSRSGTATGTRRPPASWSCPAFPGRSSTPRSPAWSRPTARPGTPGRSTGIPRCRPASRS